MIIVAIVLFFITVSADTLFWVYLWQLKEYRLDRFVVHVRDTEQGRSIIVSSRTLLLSLGFFIILAGIFSDKINRFVPFSICALLCVGVVEILFRIFNRKIKRPVFTSKAIGILVVSFFSICFLLFFPLADMFFWLLIILLLTPLIVAFIIFLFAFPTEIYTDWYLEKAKEKRKMLKNLQVIAVSGSYGKSSTKEIIAHVLSEKFSVVKTSLSNNTPLVIAKTILTQLHQNTDFFIVELGAYKKGEIKQLAELVGPTIGVTTAVSDQHLALYGSMDDVIASEMELIHALPKNSLVLLNGNSEGVQKMAEKIKHMHVLWYKSTEKSSRQYISAFNISASTKGVVWEYLYKNYHMQLNTPLLGFHTVENILPAVYLGFNFGLTELQMQNALRTLRPLPKTMERKTIIPGITIIDDSFNASPESVASAVDFLKLFPRRKFFVLSPLIELGNMSKMRHTAIGRQLAGIDFLYIANKNFIREIREGIAQKKGKTKIIIGSYRYLAKHIRSNLQKGDAIVFEGKEAGIVLKLL